MWTPATHAELNSHKTINTSITDLCYVSRDSALLVWSCADECQLAGLFQGGQHAAAGYVKVFRDADSGENYREHLSSCLRCLPVPYAVRPVVNSRLPVLVLPRAFQRPQTTTALNSGDGGVEGAARGGARRGGASRLRLAFLLRAACCC